MVVLIRFDVFNHENVKSHSILRGIGIHYSSKFLRIWVLSPKPADYTVVEYKDEREVDLYM